MKKYIVFSVILFSLFVQNLAAQGVHIFATTDTTEYIVGDYIDYSLELKYPKGYNVVVPVIKDSINNLVFIKYGKIDKKENGTEVDEIRHYIFSKYDSAAVTIPSFKITYTVNGNTPVQVSVNPVDIVVRTIEVDKKGDIQDIKTPKRVPLNWLFISIIALLVLLLLAVGYFVYKRYKQKKGDDYRETIKVVIPPHKRALEKLRELENKKLWQQGLIKEYHSEITGIIRSYFEERFNFAAMEMTTKEIIENLKAENVSTKVIITTEEFLANADMVKFAKFEPMPTVNEAMMQEAYSIVKETKPVEEEKGEKDGDV